MTESFTPVGSHQMSIPRFLRDLNFGHSLGFGVWDLGSS